MKKLSMLGVLLSTAFSLFAQRDYSINVVDTVKDYCSFSKVQVVDKRNNKANAGYIKTGAFNSRNELIPEGGMEKMMEQFITQTTQQAKQKDANTLLVIVRNYKITDRQVAGEIGTFYTRLHFYLGDGNKFMPVLNVDSFSQVSSGWDVTTIVQNLAAKNMSLWISKVAHNHFTLDESKAVTMEEIEHNISIEHQQYKVYNEAPKYGIYFTAQDFLANNPSDTGFMKRDFATETTHNYVFNLTKPNGKKGENLDNVSFFALFDGKKWYKKTSIGIVEMQFSNREFYFPESGKGIRANEDMMMAFGLIGVALSGKNGNVVYNMRYNPDGSYDQFVERLK